MSVSRSNLQIRDDLIKIVEQIELRLSDKGFIIPRDEIFGYLLELVVKKNNMNYDTLIDNFGKIDKVVDELSKSNDIIWPVDPWYGGSISIQNLKNAQPADQKKSSDFMRTFMNINYISLIASSYILIRILLAFALALISADPASFETTIDLTPYNVGIFIWFPVYSISAYTATSRISRKPELRAAVEDMETWLGKIKKSSYFHTFVLFAFYGFYLLGSNSDVRETSSRVVTIRSANGVPTWITLILILVSFYFYQIGLKKLFFDSCGGEYWEIKRYPRRIYRTTISFIIRFQQLFGLIIIIGYIVISNLAYEILIEEGINMFVGLDESFITLCFVYFFCNIILVSLLYTAKNMTQVEFWFRSSVQTDILNLFSFGIFGYLVIELKQIADENRAIALPGYQPSYFADYLLLPILVLTSMIFVIQGKFLLYRYKFEKKTKFDKFILKNGNAF